MRKFGVILSVIVAIMALLWWLWIGEADDAGLVRIVPTTSAPADPSPAPSIVVASPIDEARRGLDPIDAPGAVAEPPAAELIARTKDAPAPQLTPEEIAAGRKILTQ